MNALAGDDDAHSSGSGGTTRQRKKRPTDDEDPHQRVAGSTAKGEASRPDIEVRQRAKSLQNNAHPPPPPAGSCSYDAPLQTQFRQKIV